MNIIKDIKQHLKQTNIVEQLIYINVLFFIITALLKVSMINWFALPSGLQEVFAKPWTFISYSFVHVELFHILSNLLVLYYVGNLFLNFFSNKKLLVYYILGLLVGGIVFVLFNFMATKTTGPLIGASAAVTAILVGLTTKVPHYSLRLRFIGSVELWVITTVWVGLSVLGTVGINAGGAVAHLGGAIIGYLLTAYFNEGSIFVKLLNKRKKSSFQKVYTNSKASNTTQSYKSKKRDQRKIDAILDKISKSGYEALSKEEKDFLFSQKEE